MNKLFSLGMGALLLATMPVGDLDMGPWAQWGLAGIVIGYTMWRDWQRERRMNDAAEKQQAWVRETLVAALERNTTALEKMSGRGQ